MGRTAEDKPPKVDVGFRLSRDVVRRLKREAAERACWPAAIVEEALDLHLRNSERARQPAAN